jgi:hypothetical protein
MIRPAAGSPVGSRFASLVRSGLLGGVIRSLPPPLLPPDVLVVFAITMFLNVW